MNKTDFIANVAAKAEISKAAAAKTVDAFIATVEQALSEGEEVRLTGFGIFTVAQVAAKSGTLNFGDEGKTWSKPAHKTPKFKAGATLKAAVK